MDLNKKHLLYLIVFFLFGNLNAFGQSINISGRILSQGTQDAVEYANIVLFKQDSIFLQGTTSDSIGRFEFMNLSPNDYVLSVSCMGFEPKKILLQNLAETVEIDVFLNESALSLG
ncbi:carboxypeptidase regulatory-like domain-containing protein, partial [Bacteroides faecis]